SGGPVVGLGAGLGVLEAPPPLVVVPPPRAGPSPGVVPSPKAGPRFPPAGPPPRRPPSAEAPSGPPVRVSPDAPTRTYEHATPLSVTTVGMGLAVWYSAWKLTVTEADAASEPPPAASRTVTVPVGDWLQSPTVPSVPSRNVWSPVKRN